MIERIVSGGQSGVDQAALDAALALGWGCGGWCPRGRLTEAGELPSRYPLQQTPSADYRVRTEWNVRDSDATLILTRGPLRGGTALTVRLAEAMAKPCLVVNLDEPPSLDVVKAWLRERAVVTLNVAGPRESAQPGIGAAARLWMEGLLYRCAADADG